MRSVLLSVGDCAETMDEMARDLARISAVAEGEAVETAFVSESTAANVAAVRSATERLNSSLSETVAAFNLAADAIEASNTAAQSASTSFAQLGKTAADIDATVRVVANMAAQINAVALNATIQATRAGRADHPFASVVADLKTLAQEMSKADEDVTRRMSMIRGATGDMAGSIPTIVQKLAMVLQQTKTVALTMERQEAVTREIAESMTAAAGGTVNVSSSAGRLRTTVEEARGASMKVVAKATDMAGEAHRLDSTVKTFLREVTA
jgi:methyl-accepting chemotaxis protein